MKSKQINSKLRRSLKWLTVISVAVGVSAWFHYAWQMNTDLRYRDAKSAEIWEWGGGKRFNISMGYGWLNDDEILFDRFRTPEAPRTVWKRNIVSGRETSLPLLTNIRNEFEAEVVDDQSISPDGKWYVVSERWDHFLLARTDGSYSRTIESGDGSAYRHFIWLPDSQSFIELLRLNNKINSAWIHFVDVNKKSKLLVKDVLLPEGIFFEAATPKMELIGLCIFGTRDSPNIPDVGKPIQVVQVTLDGKSIANSINPPDMEHHRWASLSPDGKRIVWTFDYVPHSSFRSFKHLVAPTVFSPPPSQEHYKPIRTYCFHS